MAIAQLEDVVARLGRPATPEEAAQITARLEDAEAALIVRILDLVTTATPPGWFRNAVISVECDVAMRACGLVARVGVVQPSPGFVTEVPDTRPGTIFVRSEEWRRLGIHMMDVWNPYPSADDLVNPEEGLWRDCGSV